jgi:adenylate cyclase
MTTTRRLAAIMAADVVGYGRLMEQDEAGTLAALKQRRTGILAPLVAAHHGRIVKVMGDGVLVEFASAVNAVACAVELQKTMAAANDGVADDRRIMLRIGINLGDVVVEGGDLYGDGVNVAARLQQLAEPAGICVSGKLHDEVGRKLPLTYDDMGEQTIKNMATPIRVYRIAGDGSATAAPDENSPAAMKPFIAVLPFANMSGDPEQQYFSDGITEDIITELSRYRSLLVIARNSSFQFRGTSVDMDAVRRRLGVRYVVEGSVRRSGARLRITAQLIDTMAQTHLWAERYDRDMQDIFAVQDEVARTIAATLEGRVAASSAEQVKRKPTTDWRAYDYFLQGRACDASFDLAGAEVCYKRAIELDPGFVHAHAWRALALTGRYWQDQQPEQLRLAEVSAKTALSLDGNDPWSHHAMAFVALHQRKFDLAGVNLDRASNLNPNDTGVAFDRAALLVRTGRPDAALQCLDAAIRRDPFPATWAWSVRWRVLFHLKRYEDAIAALRNMAKASVWHHAYLAATCAHAGHPDDARRELAAFLQAKPDATLAVIAAADPYADETLLDHLLDGLRKAGLPE